ncbi:hypothetical protein Daus18300_012378 [Diaporthe australafricana]|uniref:Uncharacterized protein n=1 Tax=Diaporthe australafricana TaxID=127596 RepID=A0ABR3W312_9PEZI
MSPFTKRALRVIYELAKGLENYALQATCLCEPAIRSEKPITLMDELAEVQRAQGDLYGRLETCLAKYLVCQSEESKQALRHELAGFGHWEDVSSLSNFQAMLVATRDVQLRALSLTDMKAFESSISAALPYYAHLPLGLQQDLDDDLDARSRREQHMRTTARVQPHKDADNTKITQGSRERRANKTLDQDTFRGPVREQEILDSKRTQMRWDRERMMLEKERRDLMRLSEREEERRQKNLSRRTPIPVEDPEQSVKRRPDTFATVQSASSSSVPSPYDGPEVTESMESPSSDSAKKKPSGEGGLSLREDPKVTDLVGPERVLERVFPSATSRPKRATSVDLGEFSRRSEKGASELEETFEKTWLKDVLGSGLGQE